MAAAFAEVEAGGSLTMARVARRLDVQPPALYNHVRDRRALVNLLRREIAARIDTSAFAVLPWYEAIEPWARSYRAAFTTSPELIALLAVTPLDGTETSMRGYEDVASSMRRGGWPFASIVPAMVAIESFVIGSSLDVLAAPDNLEPLESAAIAPTFTRALHSPGEQGASAADRAFDVGLRALVAGLRAELAAIQDRAAATGAGDERDPE